MSTSDPIRATTQIPQPVRNGTRMPASFPDLPVDIFTGDAAKRKVAAEKWNSTVRSWWKTARMAIESDYEELSSGSNIAINKSNALSTALRTEVIARNDGDESLLGQISTISQSSSGPNRIFLQTLEPETPTLNDLWYQIEIVNGVPKIRPWYYDGVAWQDVRDSAVADAVVAVSTEQTTRLNADNALGSSIEAINAAITDEETGLAAQSTAIEAVSAAVTDEETGLVAQSNRIGALESTVGDADSGLVAKVNSFETTYVTTEGAEAAAASAITAQLDIGGTIRGAISSLDEKVFVGPNSLATKISNLESNAGGNLGDLAGRIKTIEDTYATDLDAGAMKSEAISAAATYTNQEVGKKNKTFRQNTPPAAPTVLTIGDLWINTSDTNKLNRWNGGAWEACEDTRVQSLSATVNNFSSTYVSNAAAESLVTSRISAALAPGGSIGSAIGAAVLTESNARAAADGLLFGSYTLSVTAGDAVVGMRMVASNGTVKTTSKIEFMADQFFITDGKNNGSPFEVSGGNVYIKSAFINKISANSIESGTVDSITITGSTIKGTRFESYNATTKTTTIISGGTITGAVISGAQIDGVTISSGGITVATGQIDNLAVGPTGRADPTSSLIANGKATFRGDVVIGRPQYLDQSYTKLRISSLEACRSATLTLSDDDLSYPGVQILTGGPPNVASEYAKLIVHGTTAADKTTINAGSVSAVTLSAETFNLFYANSYNGAGMTFNIGVASGDYRFNTSINVNSPHYMRFGEHVAQGVVTHTGYIMIKDSSGTPRKLAVIS